MSELDEQHQRAYELREGIRGGYDPSPRTLSGINPDSQACNERRRKLKSVIDEVGLERLIIIAKNVDEWGL